jgi:hypothetical protein
MKRLIATLLWATFLLGCGGGSSTGGGPTPNAQLNGSWHATLTSTASGGSSTVDVFIVQNGATLSSGRVALGTTCSSVGTMTGSVSGDKVNVVITGNNGDTVSVTGTASGANSLSGSYTIKTSGCGVNDDMGTFSATLIPAVQSASWTGGTQSTQYPPGNTTFTANFTEDSSGNIMGVLTFTGSSGSSLSCPSLASGPVTGTQTGNQMSLSDNQPDGLGVFGTMDNAAKNISGLYGISICSGDNGTVTMSRP